MPEHGTFRRHDSSIHVRTIRSRKSAVNGPMYEMTPDAMSTSPTTFLITCDT